MRYKEIWKKYSKVFDERTLIILNELSSEGYICDEMITISEGKEAIVFKSCDKAVKIYKLTEKFRDKIKYLKMDNRFRSFPTTKIGILYTWVKKEYMNLFRMYKNLVNVPTPYVYRNNILVMSFIGEGRPIMLNDIIDELKGNEKIFFDILNEYKKIYQDAKLIHADFSEYNLIYYNDKIYVIDVSQSFPSSSPFSEEYLEKDIRNIYNIGLRMGLNYSEDYIYEYILKKD